MQESQRVLDDRMILRIEVRLSIMSLIAAARAGTQQHPPLPPSNMVVGETSWRLDTARSGRVPHAWWRLDS